MAQVHVPPRIPEMITLMIVQQSIVTREHVTVQVHVASYPQDKRETAELVDIVTMEIPHVIIFQTIRIHTVNVGQCNVIMEHLHRITGDGVHLLATIG